MYKILLVDDEALILEGLKTIIANVNPEFTEIETALNGRQAVEKLNYFCPDLLITDIKMPFMDGLDLIRYVRAQDEKLCNVKIIVLSGYNEFTFAKTAIKYNVEDYLLKPVDKDELFQLLNKLKHQLEESHLKTEQEYEKHVKLQMAESVLKEKCLEEAIMNSFDSNDLIMNKFLNSGIDLNSSSYIMFSIGMNSTNPSSNVDLLYNDQTFTHIKRLSDELLSSQGFSYCSCIMDLNVSYLVSFQDTSMDLFKSSLKKLVYGIKNQLNFKVNIGVSSNFTEMKDVSSAYIESKISLSQGMLNGGNDIILFRDIAHFTQDSPDFMKEIREIIHAVQFQKLEEIVRQLEIIKELLKKQKNLSANCIENTYTNIYMSVFSYFFNVYGNIINVPDPFEFRKMITVAHSFEDYHYHVRKAITEIVDFIIQQKKIAGSTCHRKNIRLIIQYIHENYNKDLSLNSIAAQFSMNHSYMSTLFKEELGINFSTYLTRIRMEKAKELLQKTNLKVSKIGAEIGYTGEKHFFVTFKNYTGMSPNQYRESF